MTDHLQLIQTRLAHLAKMQECLAYSLGQVHPILLLADWGALTPLNLPSGIPHDY